nr:hypothetical protein [Chitinophaga sedimenti]
MDFTARDLQEKQKAKGLPWEIAKAFDNSAVVGKFIPLAPETEKAILTFASTKTRSWRSREIRKTFFFLLISW